MIAPGRRGAWVLEDACQAPLRAASPAKRTSSFSAHGTLSGVLTGILKLNLEIEFRGVGRTKIHLSTGGCGGGSVGSAQEFDIYGETVAGWSCFSVGRGPWRLRDERLFQNPR